LPPGVRVVRTVAAIGGALAAWAAGARRQGGSASVADLSRRLRLAAEALGPTYIKLGQIISSGEGIFPAELVAEFRKCRDQVPPEPFTAVRGVVEEDLGQPLEAVFARFEPVPLASASIAHVHLATLLCGSEVVVNVQPTSVVYRLHRYLVGVRW